MKKMVFTLALLFDELECSYGTDMDIWCNERG